MTKDALDKKAENARELGLNYEPVAWRTKVDHIMFTSKRKDVLPLGGDLEPLYTTPPQRTWVGLTDEDDIDWEEGGNLKDLVKAIEAKLKEKNT